MTETNDLLKKLLEKIVEVFHAKDGIGIIPGHNPCRVVDEAFAQAEAYGKAEFERGHKTACNEIEDLKALRLRALNAFDEAVLENVKLKKENKELMRENAKLRGLVHDQSLTLIRMKDIKDENNYLMDKISDYEKGPKQYLKDILNNISLSGVSEEMLKGFNECKDLIDIMMYDVNSDEDLARKAQEPEWHEYKKRLPLPNKAIIVKWRYADE